MRSVLHAGRRWAVAVATWLVAACGGGGGDSDAPIGFGAATGYSRIVAFGDSLTDGGTFNPTTGDGVPGNDLPAGLMFTTKPGGTWATFLAAQFGLPLTPNQQVDFGVVGAGGRVLELGGFNYAEGGARLTVEPADGGVASQPIPGLGAVPVQLATSRSITHQITDYLAENGATFRDDQLVLIQGGANDCFAFLDAVAAGTADPGSAPAVVADLASALVTQLQRLRAAGATHILYANLPDLGATPRYRSTAEAGLATALSSGYNRAVATALHGTGVLVFDTAALLGQVLASPSAFGFSNVTLPACTSLANPADPTTLTALLCSADTLVAAGADQDFLFADGVHPTAHGHRIWGEAAAASVLQSRSRARSDRVLSTKTR